MKDQGRIKADFEARHTKPEDALKFVEELKQIDLSTISESDLADKINSYFPLISYATAKIPAGTLLFRARLNENNIPFNHHDEIYAPPAKFIKRYGRANKPNERVFYCASNLKVAAFEVIQNLKNSFYPHPTAFLTVGIWETKVDLHVACIYDDPQLHSLRPDILEGFRISQEKLNNGYLGKETVTAHNIITQYFAEEFTKSNIKGDYDYKVTNFYFSGLRNMNSFIAPQFSSEKIDGLNYPSVAMKYKGDNQVLLIESADNKLEFKNALQVICFNINFLTSELQTGIIHESESIIAGNIIWKQEIYRPVE